METVKYIQTEEKEPMSAEECKRWYFKNFTVPGFFRKLIPFRLRDFYYKIKNGLIMERPHMIRTGLPLNSFYEVDIRMLYGMMNLLVEFLEKQKPFERIDWDWCEEHAHARDEMTALKKWWDTYEDRQNHIELMLDSWSEEEDPVKKEAKFQYHTYLETAMDREEEEMLIRLIKIRPYLWT